MLTPYYSQDGVSIVQADCREALPHLPAECIDLVLTDPPYLVNYQGRWDGARRGIVGDADGGWIGPVFSEIHRVLKPDSFCITFYGWPHADLFVGTFKSLGFRIVSHLAFVKNVWGLGRFSRGQHETGYLLAKGRPRVSGAATSDVIDWVRDRDAVHPNQKPLGALYPLLEAYAPPSGLVLDPFMGSGSTLLAARDFGLRAVGIEIEGRWCAYARARLSQGILLRKPHTGSAGGSGGRRRTRP